MKNKIKFIEFVIVCFFCFFGCTTEPNVRELGKTPIFVPYDEEPILVRRVNPVCPIRAQLEEIDGIVIVRAEVFEDGTIGAVEIVRSLQDGYGGWDGAVIFAVKHWKFIPATYQGNPIALWVTFPVECHLP